MYIIVQIIDINSMKYCKEHDTETCALKLQLNSVNTGVPRVKVNISGFNSRVDAESQTSYTHGSNVTVQEL